MSKMLSGHRQRERLYQLRTRKGGYPEETEGVDDSGVVAKVRSHLPRSHFVVV